jgi:hypothetical protein
VAELIVITGPPGHRELENRLSRPTWQRCLTEVHSSPAMSSLRSCVTVQFRPGSQGADKQNAAVIDAAAATAGHLAFYCDVVYDGVVAPAFRATFLEQTGLAHMHYAVLMPTLDLCLDRVQKRKGHGFTDRDAATRMWNQFHQADIETSCLFEDSDMPPSELARLIARHVVCGSIRYPPAAS